ncbi:MAG TPA: tRNA uridine-5-carboxymethylaminomethyl(34) synthesis GTPase MnmE [Stellaceae bacterium]|nr:tRNA uridine-5-carboxymethylaminomethyl(34) synthesis GTPase MnmE [Stellaceae bacterium]
MRPLASDTIYAPATAAGRAAIAIVRLSGPEAGPALKALTGKLPPPRVARHVRVRDPGSGEGIDDGLALWFPGPRSVTGEDVAELHLHGSRAVLTAVMAALGRLGLRLAEPGEFTRRAFQGGKLDLVQAEAVADLAAAETEAQRRQALRQLDGSLGDLYRGWSQRLLRLLAHLEAAIDFPDEDLPPAIEAEVAAETASLAGEIALHLADGHRGERLRDGIAVAILGPPNAGKSSLLNQLARREAAITSPVAGTTRDVIEVAIDLAGYPIVLADTAGLRESADLVEQEGLRRALGRAEAAELRLFVFDAARPQDASGAGQWPGRDTMLVANKIDLARNRADLPPGALAVSALTGDGIPALVAALAAHIAAGYDFAAPLLTRARHREALEIAADALQRSLAADYTELRAEDLRLAWRSLGHITGHVDVEDLLDVIFAEFCLGK